MIICATGHRPDKLGGYSQKIFEQLVGVARAELERLKPAEVISGMALGWDTAVAMACIDLHIPYIAAVPCHKQAASWPYHHVVRYRNLLKCAKRVHFTSIHCGTPAYHHRNIWMVDNSQEVAALYNGDNKGGTAHCVHYAMSRKHPIHNAWEAWIKANKDD